MPAAVPNGLKPCCVSVQAFRPQLAAIQKNCNMKTNGKFRPDDVFGSLSVVCVWTDENVQ